MVHHYRAGDAILTVTNDMEYNRLSLPMMSLFSKKCSAFSPVKFMETDEHECQIVIDKDTDCSQIPELNAINYVKGFRILKNIDLINGGGEHAKVGLFQNLDENNHFDSEEEDFLQPIPEVCIYLDADEKLCVHRNVSLNEELPDPTKV